MSNLIATLARSNKGDEIIMGDEAHMFWNESAGQAALAGVQTRLVPNDVQGRINPDDVAAAIRPPGNLHFPRTSMVCLENTHNRCSGQVLTPEDTKAVCDVAHEAGVPVHLDVSAHLQRLGSLGSATRGIDPRSGRPELLPVQVAELPGGFGAGRLAGVHRQRQAVAQDAGRRNAAGRSAGCGRAGGAGHDD